MTDVLRSPLLGGTLIDSLHQSAGLSPDELSALYARHGCELLA